jgi:DNA-binding CsgD family transcriptional regulator
MSWLETRCGNLDVARQVADEAVNLARLTGSRWMEAWAGMQVAYVAAHSGDVEQVRWIREEGVRLVRETANALFRQRGQHPHERHGPSLGLWVAAAQALFELSRGDHAAAWSACEPLVSAVEARGIGEPVPLFFLPDALEALIGLGHLDRAAALLGLFERRARELDRPWALVTAGRCKALLLAAHGDPSGALDAVDAAIAGHARIDLPFDRARTLLVRGVIERRLRRRARAKASFEEALGEFERIGTPLWAERARNELGRLGLRRALAEELTESERRVAELTAKGMTRREVSRALFVSPKTVDATLVRVYRKLGVRSRAELGARMAVRRDG